MFNCANGARECQFFNCNFPSHFHNHVIKFLYSYAYSHISIYYCLSLLLQCYFEFFLLSIMHNHGILIILSYYTITIIWMCLYLVWSGLYKFVCLSVDWLIFNHRFSVKLAYILKHLCYDSLNVSGCWSAGSIFDHIGSYGALVVMVGC